MPDSDSKDETRQPLGTRWYSKAKSQMNVKTEGNLDANDDLEVAPAPPMPQMTPAHQQPQTVDSYDKINEKLDALYRLLRLTYGNPSRPLQGEIEKAWLAVVRAFTP